MAEDGHTRWFGVSARRFLLVGLVLFSAGMLLYRAAFAVEEDEDYDRMVGQRYTDVMFYLGQPDEVERRNDGGIVLHYEEVRAVDGVFEKSRFRLSVNARGRIYAFERD